MADPIIEAGAAASWNKYAEQQGAPEFTWEDIQSIHVRQDRMEQFRAGLRDALEAVEGQPMEKAWHRLRRAAYEGDTDG